MNKQEFNIKCAEYMGGTVSLTIYNPYDDMNQLAEVVEKLVKKESHLSHKVRRIAIDLTNNKPLKQALRDFITNTIEVK